MDLFPWLMAEIAACKELLQVQHEGGKDMQRLGLDQAELSVLR